jgi:hypothetical protein
VRCAMCENWRIGKFSAHYPRQHKTLAGSRVLITLPIKICILPALGIFQLAPAIQHQALILHRINGYFTDRASSCVDSQGLGSCRLSSSLTSLPSLVPLFDKRTSVHIHHYHALHRLHRNIISKTTYYEARHCYLLDDMFFNNRNMTESPEPDCRAYSSGRNPCRQVLVLAESASRRADPTAAGFA